MANLKKFFEVAFLVLLVTVVVGCSKENKEKEPVVETSEVGSITGVSAVCGGVVTSDGGSAIVERGVCWSKESNPLVSGSHLVVEGGVGSFNCTLNGLEPNTTYHVKAYAINNVGIAYGAEISFVTLEELHLPVVHMPDVIEISDNAAVCTALAEEAGGGAIIEKGFCWSKEGNPTMDGHHLAISPTEPFEGRITGLESNSMYYLRAYAINGDGVGYSPETSFTTLTSIPLISLLAGDGFLADGDVADVNVEYQYGFVMSSPIGLSSLVVMADGQLIEEVEIDGNEYSYVGTLMFTMEREIIGECMITAVVTDVYGATSSASFTVFVNVESEPLSVGVFEWVRAGASPGTGLEEFGLKWEVNAKDIYARVRPLDGVSLYNVDPALWWGVTTEADKGALFAMIVETSRPIDEYANVSILVDKTYDDVLGVILSDGSMRLIHVTLGLVTMTNTGTRVAISGEWK